MDSLTVFIIKKYEDGSSYEYLYEYLQKQSMADADIKAMLKRTHQEHWEKRKKRALIDVTVVVIAVLFLAYSVHGYLKSGNLDTNHLHIVALFIWIPFAKSAYCVFSGKKVFGQL